MATPLRVLDVQEKEVGSVRPPSFPTPQSAAAGFPLPKKRSRFAEKSKRQREAAAASTAAQPAAGHAATGEKASIDRENRERLRDMGAGEIAQAREELLSNLDPALLQILLRRANLDDEANESLPTAPKQEPQPNPQQKSQKAPQETPKQAPQPTPQPAKTASVSDPPSKKSVSFAEPHKDGDALLKDTHSSADLFPLSTPEDAISAASHNHDHSMHFPQTPAVPDLDPADPNFLENLHSKYFPNLPADPARLAWMAPVPTADSPADRESPYYPGQATVAVSQLRFDFRGRLIPPRASREIPVSKGLHHHGQAPEAAGYTVAELAHLARSAVPAQRCVAFQTLGRLLYRLGHGEWGQSGADIDKDPRSAVGQGIWRCVKEGRVLETLHEAASVEEGQGHRGSRAYAIEAIWLFEKGGWKEHWKGR